jgi:putative NIF3 family GTP cyclohydrolase 1 type 2
VIPIAQVTDILAALRRSHPYEEPAFDLVQLAAAPEKVGQGRIGSLPDVERLELFARIKKELELSHLLIAGPQRGTVDRAACCAGACGEYLDDAIRAKAGLYLTGELRHHDAVKAAAAGVTVVCTLHSNSERAVLKRLSSRLAERAPGLSVVLSRHDRDPFVVG